MEVLDLSYNNLQSEGGKALASALEVNKVLTKLDLQNNRLGAKGAQPVRDAVSGRDAFELLVRMGHVECVETAGVVLSSCGMMAAGDLILSYARYGTHAVL